MCWFRPVGLALLPALSGCFSGPAMVGSFAADGVSYAASGKTVADHIVSGATMRDCSLLRATLSGPVCVRLSSGGSPFEDRRRRDYLVVLGSFVERQNAERLAAEYARYGSSVVPVPLDGLDVYRVIVGPLSMMEAQAIGRPPSPR